MIDPQIVFIVGLPGSGQNALLSKYGGYSMFEKALPSLQSIVKAIEYGDKICIASHVLCSWRNFEQYLILFDRYRCRLILFENDNYCCKFNLKQFDTYELVDEDCVDDFSKQYMPEQYSGLKGDVQIIPVVDHKISRHKKDHRHRCL